MPSAFISHSTPDDSFVAELESFLRAIPPGYDEVFNDSRSIVPDAEFWSEIEAGIRRCDALVVVISRASVASKWVTKEVELAHSLNKRVIPLWIEDCEIPAVFATRDVIDFRPRSRIKDRKLAPSRILRHSPDKLFGRDNWLDALDAAWAEADAQRLHAGRLGRRRQDVAGRPLGQPAHGGQGLARRRALLRLVLLQPGHRRIAANLVRPVHPGSPQVLRRPRPDQGQPLGARRTAGRAHPPASHAAGARRHRAAAISAERPRRRAGSRTRPSKRCCKAWPPTIPACASSPPAST